MMFVTHDAMAASYCDRIVFIKDGQLYYEIYCGDNRQIFYQKIIDVLALLGGNEDDFSTDSRLITSFEVNEYILLIF